MPKHKERLDNRKIMVINFVTMLMGFSQAMLTYVMSTYLEKASGTESVGPFYFGAYAVLLVLLLNMHKLAKAWGKTNVFLVAVLANIVSLSFLSVMPMSLAGAGMMVAYMISSGLEWVAMDAILEDYSVDKESGRIRGKHLTILNAGFLLGPFLSAKILERFDFEGIFVFLLIFNAAMFVYALVRLRGSNGRFESEVRVGEIISKVAKRPDIRRIYYVSFILELFYALMVIYTPLYLLDLGLDWGRIGIILTIMLVPFVLVQYPAGIMADRKWGERGMLVFSIAVMGMFTCFCYLMRTPDVLAWAAILFGTRVGAALVEVLRDSYFYKRIDGRDVDLINFFRTAMPMAYIVAAVISFAAVSVFSVRSIFFLIALAVFSALVPALRLERKG